MKTHRKFLVSLLVGLLLTTTALCACGSPMDGAASPGNLEITPPPASPSDLQPADTTPSGDSQQTNTPAPSDPQPSNTGNASGITMAEAREIALAHAGISADEVTFLEREVDRDDGRKIYEIEFYTANHNEYDYEIDVKTGDILDWDHDAERYAPVPADKPDKAPADSGSAEGTISKDDAKAKVLAKVPGATLDNIREFKTDRDDGRLEYEGTLIYDGMEYEFEIDAASGDFRSWEKESVYD